MNMYRHEFDRAEHIYMGMKNIEDLFAWDRGRFLGICKRLLMPKR